MEQLEINKSEVDYFWKPNSKPQETFLSLPDTIFECLYGGALGGGKTEVLLHHPIARKWIEHPKFQAIYFRESFPELEKSLIKRALEIYTKLGATYNGTKHVFTFPSGAKIWFDYITCDQDALKHDTDEYNAIYWEELSAFTKFPYIYMMSRCRTSTEELPAIIRAASNPGGIGHSWIRERFIDPAPSGYRRILENKTLRIFIPAKATDNKDLLRNDPTYFDRLKNLPEALYKAKVEGDWYILAGQVFEEFRDRHYPGEPENAVHVCNPFPIPSYWPRVLSIDWGYSANTIAHWSAISPDGRVYFYREYKGRKVSIATWANELRTRSLGENLTVVVIDPSAKKEEGHEKTIFQQFIDASGFNQTETADNARIAGKMNFHDFLRWKKIEKINLVPSEPFDELKALTLGRMFGSESEKAYRSSYISSVDEGIIPRFQVFEGACPELLKVIPLCIYRTDDKHKEDVMDFDGDDAYDCARYNLMAVDRYVRSCQEQFEKIKELDRILKLRGTIDETSFYRMMENYERSGNRGKVVPIRRHTPNFAGRVRTN